MAMESNTKLQNNPLDFDWPYHEDLFQFDKALELPPLDGGLFDFDLDSLSLPFHWENLSHLEFESAPEIPWPDKHMIIPVAPLYDDTVLADQKPLRMIKLEDHEEGQHEQHGDQIERGFNHSSWRDELEDYDDEKGNMRLLRSRCGRRKSSVLRLEEIQKHFHIPISEAAKAMNVGLTVLKKRCRELNIMRWPHRKLKSLKSLIKNVKEMGLTSEIKVLEEHKRLVEELPDMDLTHRTKRLRQACFKANYKKRRSNSIATLH